MGPNFKLDQTVNRENQPHHPSQRSEKQSNDSVVPLDEERKT